MKISANWLREWVSPHVTDEVLAERLTMLGLEVESLLPAGPACEGVITAAITALRPHPTQADLKVCELDAAQQAPVIVICESDDLSVGELVALALPGSCLSGKQIEEIEWGGVTARGKLCSSLDLGITESADILKLPAQAVIGEPVAAILAFDDLVFDFSLTPNRGDCLSLTGIAREVAAAYGSEYRAPTTPAVIVETEKKIAINVDETFACPRYSARVLSDISPSAETPLWITEKLRRSQIRTLHPVVDIANLVMLELGQPLHTFDIDTLQGSLQVRFSRTGEMLRLLDNNDRILDDKTLVIADQQQVLALAGIMGGLSSAIGPGSQNILLESAYFSPTAIIGRARQYGLHTDASHRFERGVDPELSLLALERASALILQICGGKAGPVICHTDTAALPAISPIHLEASQIRRCLGIEIPATEIVQILTALGMQVTGETNHWQVISPSWRFDIEQPVDLIEEIVRFYRYDQLPLQVPQAKLRMQDSAASSMMIKQCRHTLVQRGFQEVITYSFVDPSVQSAIFPEEEGLALENPISPQQSVMRTSLVPGLVGALQYNLNRQQQRGRLFEIGIVFKRGEQRLIIGGIVCGNYYKNQWDIPFESSNIFDLKQDITAMCTVARMVPFSYQAMPPESDFSVLHPGQAMCLSSAGTSIGWAGRLHPAHIQRFNLPSDSYLFEIEMEKIAFLEQVAYHTVAKFPVVRRDIALIVPQDIPAGQMLDKITEVGKIFSVELFDVYCGEGIDPMKKSIAMSLTFQHKEKTLTEIEVDEQLTQILAMLSKDFGAKLRW